MGEIGRSLGGPGPADGVAAGAYGLRRPVCGVERGRRTQATTATWPTATCAGRASRASRTPASIGRVREPANRRDGLRPSVAPARTETGRDRTRARQWDAGVVVHAWLTHQTPRHGVTPRPCPGNMLSVRTSA